MSRLHAKRTVRCGIDLCIIVRPHRGRRPPAPGPGRRSREWDAQVLKTTVFNSAADLRARREADRACAGKTGPAKEEEEGG